MKTIKILVTGGGSSGHISPALATIRRLKAMAGEADWSPVFRYIGGKRGLEKGLIEAEGLDFVGVETGKLRRYFSLQNFVDVFRTPVGVVQSLWQVAKFRPDVVLSTGGYVCVPPVVAAWLLRVPIVTHEQTVQIGLANRITARFASRIGLGFESARQELPPKLQAKTFVAGNPVREEIYNGNREEAIKLAGFAPQDKDLPTVYVTGGSQGARIINRAVEAELPNLLRLGRIIHQCGQQPEGQEQDYDRLTRAASVLPPELRRRYYLTRFVRQEINHVYALADLVVGRAGAGTVTEVCVLGKAALYIPLVPTGGDEQTRNAKTAEQVGAASIIKQDELTGALLLSEVERLLSDHAQLAKMGQAAHTLFNPTNAAQIMADAVLALAKN